ncbi:MAG: ABC transporter permease [Gemmatimonadota bacterium]|nr:MAG: ABC transporter permease [Gemmatimonadota bacterium]
MKRPLLYLLISAITLAAIYPILVVIGISLRPAGSLYSTSLALIPAGASLEAYRVVLFEKPFGRWLANSAAVSLLVTIVGVALASTAGYAFSRFRFRGRTVGMAMFLVTQMFPATMLLLPLYVLMRNLGLTDSLPGLAVAYSATALPFCVWTMKGYFDSIPAALEEAALVDGAGRFGTFVRIILPLSAPALAITALFSFMAGWSEFIVARVVLSSQELYTLPLGLESLSNSFQTEWANYSAGAILVSIPVVVVFLMMNRFLVSGLTVGGIKD